mgnify:CR=1 FL=1
MVEPIVKSIDVPCPQAMAFDVFIKDMATWWPMTKFSVSAMGGFKAKGLKVDAKLGGTIVEVSFDGVEHLWGTITAFNPYDSVLMDFHIGRPGEPMSNLEITFQALGEKSTRVKLTQTNWEAFGEKAPWMRDGYFKGWAVIFDEAYRGACGAEPVAKAGPSR